MTDTAEIKEKRKKSNGKKNKNQDDLTGNEPLIIVSSNDKIDDENVFIEEINQIHKKEEDVQHPPTDEENDAESIENEIVKQDEDVVVQPVKINVPVSYHSPEKPSLAQISEVEALELLDQKKVLELKEAFTLFDLDGDGIISELDLKNTFLTFGSDVSDAYVREMLSEAMHPMDFDAFVVLLGYKTIELDPEEDLLEAMSVWDPEGTGLLCEEEMKTRLIIHGDRFTAKEAFIALEEAPIAKGTGNGFHCHGPAMIDYREFCKILSGFRKKMKNQ